MQPRRQYQLQPLSPDKRRTALDSFDVYKPFVIEPKDVCWSALVTYFLSNPDAMSTTLLYAALQIALRQSQNIQPASWGEILKDLHVTCASSPVTKDMEFIRDFVKFVEKLTGPDQLSSFMTDHCQKVIAPANPDNAPDQGFTLLRRSWLGIYLRRCHLAYLKLSESAQHQLSKAYNAWIDDGDTGSHREFTLDTVETPGYLLITTSVDERSHAHMEAYERFEYEKHVGNTSGATHNLRQYFDQQFTGGRQPPRQHALNAIAQHYFSSGEIELARVMGNEAVDIARTVSDRQTLMNISSMMRRLPPKPPPLFLNDPHENYLRKALLDREDAEASKSDCKMYGQYSIMQLGISPLDLLFDVNKGIDMGEPISFLFQKRFEATGCLDLPHNFSGVLLETQWQIWAIDTQLWRMAGLATVAEVGDKIILANTSPKEDIRLHTICTGGRQLFQRGCYLQAFAVLLHRDNWAQLSLVQYHYWSSEVWYLMWDIATRRGQEKFKREFLEPRRPPPSPFAKRDHGRKSAASIRRLILEAAEALKVKNHTQATFLIMDALHYAETNGYWYLYRSAVPIFADLELQRGKIESARRRIEETLGQVARGEDLEQRAMTYAVYAKVKMAGDRTLTRDGLHDAIYYLKKAESDYRKLEMYASVQDMLYLQAVVHEALGEKVARDEASERLMEVEKTEKKAGSEMDEGMVAIWDAVCEIGAAIASGDTFWEQ